MTARTLSTLAEVCNGQKRIATDAGTVFRQVRNTGWKKKE
jgi:hypothetical protein